MKQTRQAGSAFKHSILLRCLWVELFTRKTKIQGSNSATGRGKMAGKWRENNRKMAGKWQENGGKVAGKWMLKQGL
jgi:hypothetical protein